VAETTQLYTQLTACKNPKFQRLYQIVEASRLAQMTEQVARCRFAIAAPLFLYLKAQFADGMTPDEKTISYAKKIGGFECSVAVFLLGLALGYDKTYDAFYECAKLPFFKKKVNKGGLENAAYQFPNNPTTGSNEDNSVTTKDKKRHPEKNGGNNGIDKQRKSGKAPTYKQEGLFGDDELGTNMSNPSKPIMWMRKTSKGTTTDVRPVYNEDECKRLLQIGYEQVTIFYPKVKALIASYGFDPEAEKKRLNSSKKK
jgi:hypothetical protein